ncbi:MAG: glycosyltransferase family 4 protein [Verrucomicrobiota bacterium]
MAETLTIIHTEASDGWGGQEIRIFSEAGWFREQGHRVILITPAHAQLQQRAREAGFETFQLSFTKASQAGDFFRLGRILQQMRPHVLGTHSSTDSWVGMLAGRRQRVPVLLRYRHVSTPVKPNWLNRFFYRTLCHHTLTTGECIRQPLIETLGVDPLKVTSAPTGIEPPPFPSDRETARVSLCQELKLPPTSRFVGCVAVLRSWKGQALLMDAFQSVAARFPHHHLLLVGNGPGWPGLNEHRDSLTVRERILFTGHQADPWRYFRALDAALLPSTKNEGIPQSLLQAMFAGCPALGSRVGGIPEIIQHNATGLLFEPASAEAIATVLVQVLSQPEAAQARALKALEYVQQHHTRQRMGEQVLAVIQRQLAFKL